MRINKENDKNTAKKINIKKYLSDKSPIIGCVLMIIILIIIPTGYEDALTFTTSDRAKVRVLSTDESSIVDTGLVRSGEQRCEVEILTGMFKGKTGTAVNRLSGSLESDKMFSKGDTALVTIDYEKEEILYINMIDHYRINSEIILALVFIIFLILFAGKTGFRAVFSFVFTILCIWKILIPQCLNGVNPIFAGIVITVILTIAIISLVYGFDKRTVAACAGSVLGVITACILGALFTDMFKIHGAVMSYSESLLYSGYQHLNLTQIFMASIFIGSSGAMMDLAVDITSAVYEVKANCPDISRKKLIKSGMNVGKAAMGTMTTTLLLAYSGGYIALLMVFMAQGTPIIHILNYKYVSAEIIQTVVGSFGLVAVAPFTAVTSGIIFTR